MYNVCRVREGSGDDEVGGATGGSSSAPAEGEEEAAGGGGSAEPEAAAGGDEEAMDGSDAVASGSGVAQEAAAVRMQLCIDLGLTKYTLSIFIGY